MLYTSSCDVLITKRFVLAFDLPTFGRPHGERKSRVIRGHAWDLRNRCARRIRAFQNGPYETATGRARWDKGRVARRVARTFHRKTDGRQSSVAPRGNRIKNVLYGAACAL